MRFAIGSAALLVLTASAIACSTAAPPPPAGEDQQEQKAPAPAATFTGPTDPVPAPAAAAAPVDPNAVPGAAVGVPGAPVAADPGLDCLPDSMKEIEPNNDPTTATVVPSTAGSPSICGRLEAGDIDHISFVMPTTGLRRFTYRPEAGFGDVNIEATAGGVPFDPNGNWPFMAGQPYVFKISAPGNQRPVDYRLRFTFTP